LDGSDDAVGIMTDPDAVCGMGCVGRGSSPGVVVTVGTAVSRIGLMGCPVSRFKIKNLPGLTWVKVEPSAVKIDRRCEV
jgi:hypothetical protein